MMKIKLIDLLNENVEGIKANVIMQGGGISLRLSRHSPYKNTEEGLQEKRKWAYLADMGMGNKNR